MYFAAAETSIRAVEDQETLSSLDQETKRCHFTQTQFRDLPKNLKRLAFSCSQVRAFPFLEVGGRLVAGRKSYPSAAGSKHLSILASADAVLPIDALLEISHPASPPCHLTASSPRQLSSAHVPPAYVPFVFLFFHIVLR